MAGVPINGALSGGLTNDLRTLATLDRPQAPAVGAEQPQTQDGSRSAEETTADASLATSEAPAAPLSKNQQKKLKRKQQWEDGREDRKRKRKAARVTQRERRREERRTKMAEAEAAGLDPEDVVRAERAKRERVRVRNPVPVAFIVDCDFEQYMLENELISLSSQITRCYADNRAGSYQAHLYMSSWKGKMRERFDGILSGQYRRWQDFHVTEEDFVAAAREAHATMTGKDGGKIQGAMAIPSDQVEPSTATDETNPPPVSGTISIPASPSVVYLTSDSPHTLDRLEPYTSYVIGGIVDRNREKGLCYNRALERGVRTAKLPIGDYMVMASRQVLTTNQVVDIMCKWLEHGSWADAFTAVMPKRKGGQLRTDVDGAEDGEEGDGDQEHDEDEGEEDGASDIADDVAESAAREVTSGPSSALDVGLS